MLLLPLTLAGSALARGVDADQRYAVEMELWIDGELRGAPSIVAVAGQSASVEVANASANDGWKIELLVEPPGVSEGAPVGAVWLELVVYERGDREWETLADSLLGVPDGQTAVMSVVGAGIEEAEPENSLVYLMARATRLQPETSAP